MGMDFFGGSETAKSPLQVSDWFQTFSKHPVSDVGFRPSITDAVVSDPILTSRFGQLAIEFKGMTDSLANRFETAVR